MTSLGFPGLSSQSVSRFFDSFRPENPETDWEWTGMTSLGFPGLSSQSVSRFFGPFRPENPETDWDDKPGLPRVVIPFRFRFLLALFGQKTPKRIGMTSLGFPGLSSQSISGFFGPFRPEKPETDPFRPENPETDWDDKPGLPRVVILVGFRIFWPFSARKPRNGLV